jgi:hypothetical protein
MILRTSIAGESDASSIVRRMNELLKSGREPRHGLHNVRQNILRKLRRRFRLENRNAGNNLTECVPNLNP